MFGKNKSKPVVDPDKFLTDEQALGRIRDLKAEVARVTQERDKLLSDQKKCRKAIPELLWMINGNSLEGVFKNVMETGEGLAQRVKHQDSLIISMGKKLDQAGALDDEARTLLALLEEKTQR